MNPIPEIFFVCPGLGHIARGYETFTRQCFDALKAESSFRLRLFKGAGPANEQETKVPILKRTGFLPRLAAKLAGRIPYDAEQLSFALGLIPYLLRAQPNIVYFSDHEVGVALWYWRKISGQRFRLLFSNGGPAPPPFPRWDHVHQVSPEHYEAALHSGVPTAKQTLIPYGLNIPREPQILNCEEKKDLRRRLGLPVNAIIVLSVGMLSGPHKRMDYVIQEIRRLPEPRPYLVLLGQFVGTESDKIVAMARELLTPEQYRIATVSPEQVQQYYSAADVFVLASLSEGFGRVLVEALVAGLPIIAHDFATTRYVVGSNGYLADLRPPGSLSTMIVPAIRNDDPRSRIARQREAYERFSWDRLALEYSAMLLRIATGQNQMDTLVRSRNS